METKTLHELSLDFPGATKLERIQNLVEYLFKGTPANLKDVTWDYFIKQFVTKYYNRMVCFDNVDIFRSFLINEVMNHARFLSTYNVSLYEDVIAGGFNLTETANRLIDEDRTRNLGSDSNENNVGSSKHEEGKTFVETGINNIEDAGTTKSTTDDNVLDKTTQAGTTTGKQKTVNDDDGTSTTKTTNTGTTDTATTGTEDNTRNSTTSVEGASDSKVVGDTYNRTLVSETPGSIVNAATTGNPDDINWKFATRLQDDINKGTTTTDNHDESSTVSSGKDLLTLDRNEKMTDNRTATTTGSNKNQGTQDIDSEGASNVTTDYARDADSTTETTLEQTSKRTDNKSGSQDLTGKVDNTLNKVSSRNDNEQATLDKTETLNRTWAKLSPYEGNVSLYQFVIQNINDPITAIVDSMESVFMSQFVETERLAPFNWQERDGCVAKL